MLWTAPPPASRCHTVVAVEAITIERHLADIDAGADHGPLLGTGPLVDPGFRGKLLIPMHNLTASDYELATKEALIWIEFTKTTYNCEPIESEAASPRPFEEFPDKKWRLSAEVGIVAPKEGDADRGRCQPALRSTHSVPEALLRVEHHLESGFG
jgi:hypothetical protein